MNLPSLNAHQCQQLDHLLSETYRIPIPNLMELAGFHSACLTRTLMGGTLTNCSIAIGCGSGNNAGDGMVAACYLQAWQADVTVILCKDPLTGLAQDQFERVHHHGIPITLAETLSKAELSQFDMLIDAIFGFGLQGPPRGISAILIDEMNQSKRPILSIDIPSGLNATTGEAYSPTIQATATLTMACLKTGFKSAKSYLGDLYVADIGVPPEAYKKLGLKDPVSPFTLPIQKI